MPSTRSRLGLGDRFLLRPRSSTMADRSAAFRFRPVFRTLGIAIKRSWILWFGLWGSSCSSELASDAAPPTSAPPTRSPSPPPPSVAVEASRQAQAMPESVRELEAAGSSEPKRTDRAGDPSSDGAGEPVRETESDGVGETPIESNQADSVQTKLPLLYAIHREVFVFEKPAQGSRKLGYLRAGARVVRSAEPSGFEGCPGGFFGVAPEGFVCAELGAKLEPGNTVSELLAATPDRLAPLPFVYARSRGATPPIYTKLPSFAEQRAFEQPVRRRGPATDPFGDLPPRATPDWLLAGSTVPTLFGGRRDPEESVARRAVSETSFALLGAFERDARRFGLLSDMTFVPLDRLERVSVSSFHGLSLDEVTLPVGFAMRRSAWLYTHDPIRGLSPVRALTYRETVPLTGKRVQLGRSRYAETVDGHLLRDDGLLEVAAPSRLPGWARANRSWIHVSISKQSLVAYRGETPVYVTLVSTGADGLGDPETTRSTVLGQFRVHTKHVTTQMKSDADGDEYSLPDVPWVQYFSANYALHAAYWHDAFGTPQSHGCINLSPKDARFLFNWTDPPVPQGWHGSFSLHSGTLIQITP